MAILWQSSLVPFIDPYGDPYVGAKAYFFDAGTTTPRVVYKDADNSQPHDHPLLANGGGMFPAVFLPAGDFRLRIEDSTGVTIWDVDGISTPSAGDSGGGGGGDTDPTLLFKTGMMIDAYGAGVMSGWVRCNGRSIGNAASGASERANADCEALFLHLWTQDATLPVSGGRGASAAGDWAAGKRIDLPNQQLRARIGMASMGGTASTLFADITIDNSETVDTLGATAGTATHTLTAAQMPVHGHTGTTDTAGAHTHPSAVVATASREPSGSNGNLAQNGNTGSAGNHTHSFTTGNAGSGHAHPNVQPSMLVTVYLKL